MMRILRSLREDIDSQRACIVGTLFAKKTLLAPESILS